MTKEEQEDVDVLKRCIVREKVNCYDLIKTFSDLTATQLADNGHKSFEGAMKFSFESSRKAIEKLYKDHFRKWPD